MADLNRIQTDISTGIMGNDLSGNITYPVNADSSGNLFVKTTSAGPVTPGTVANASSLIGGQFNISLPTLTNGQQSAIQLDSSGRLIISPIAGGALAGGAVTTNPPTYVTGTTDPLSLTIDGDLRVADIINTAGQCRAQSVTTTSGEALGGATILANRKVLSITPTNGTIYYGVVNPATTASCTPLFKNQTVTFAIGSNMHVYVICANGTVDCRILEGS